MKISKDDFYLPTLHLLNELGGSASIEEIEAGLIERLGFSQDVLDETYPTSGDNIVTDKMSWARSHLKFPGFVTNTKGVWILTERGRSMLDASVDAIRREVLKAKSARRVAKLAQQASLADPLQADDMDDAAETSEGTATWSDQLLAALQAMDPSAFERLCQRLLREYGFVRVEVTGKSGDGGIDGQGVLRVNLVSFHVLFQCKRYKGSVGAGTIRDFRGAMQGRADKGLVITTGTFTPDARREATRDGAPAIDLIDGDALCELLRDKSLGVTVRPVTTYEISVDAAFFDTI